MHSLPFLEKKEILTKTKHSTHKKSLLRLVGATQHNRSSELVMPKETQNPLNSKHPQPEREINLLIYDWFPSKIFNLTIKKTREFHSI